MALKSIQVPGGDIVDFPDTMSDSAIRQVLNLKYPSQDAQQSKTKSLQNAISPKQEAFNYMSGVKRDATDTIRDALYGLMTGLGKGGQMIGEGMEKIPGFSNLQQKVQGATGLSVPKVNMDEIFSPIKWKLITA